MGGSSSVRPRVTKAGNTNYTIAWKRKTNFKAIDASNFEIKYKKDKLFFLDKVDGHLGAMIYEEGKARFQTTTGLDIFDLPVLHEYESLLKKLNISKAVLIGELVGVKNGNILPFQLSTSIIKTSYKPANAVLINHYLYDIYELDGKNPNFPTALSFIVKNFTNRMPRIKIPNHKYGGVDEFHTMYKEVIKSNSPYEGIVARFPTTGKALKIKPVQSFDLACIGVGNVSMPAWKKNQISYLVVAFYDGGVFRMSSRVGTGLKQSEREELFEQAQVKSVQEYKGEYLLKPGTVVEVGFQECIPKPMPSFEYSNGIYTPSGFKGSATMRFPSFIRWRKDKSVKSNEVGLYQIPIK